MKTLLDVHTHTVASGHAFSTLQEMAAAASEKGLKLLGITEHAPGIPGTCSPIYFRNLHVHIISHPGDGTAEVDFEPIVLASKEHHTLLEINNSSLNPVRKKLTARDNNLTILRLCKKYEVPVILGSDAHISFDIARYDHIYELLQETRFPEELILNDKVEAFKKFIGR